MATDKAASSNVPQFRHRVLVVDDEPPIREITRFILQSEGYEVLTATDGLDGLHALSKFLPEVIISDLNMPRMSGLEFLAIVRERFPWIATIAMSGDYIPGENPNAIPVDAFFAKGQSSVAELVREVRELLAASPRGRKVPQAKTSLPAA